MKSADLPRYLTVDEAREYLRFKKGPSPAHRNDSVYFAIATGVIPAWCICRRGRTVLFDRLALDEWMHERTPERVDPKRRAREILADIQSKKAAG